MSGHRSVRDRSPTRFPYEVIDSSSDTHPSETLIDISSDNEDSSIQVLTPLSRPPPVVIDLTISLPRGEAFGSPIFVVELRSQSHDELMTPTFATLLELTYILFATVPPTNGTSVVILPREEDHMMSDLERRFYPVLTEVISVAVGIRIMPICGRYPIET